MTRSITIAGVTRTTVWEARDFELVEHAFRGEVGLGGFDLDDPTASYDVVGLKQVLVSESTASPTRVFTGYTADRGLGRGEEARAASERKWDVAVVDANTLLNDRLIEGGGRPAETDVERVQWLLGRPYAVGLADTYVAAGNTVAMPSNTSYSGQYPRDVLEDCAAASGKNYYVVYDGTDLALFYDLDSSANWSSTLRLSDVDADVDNTITWAPQWRGAPGLRRDPSELYSGVWLDYPNGYVFLRNGSIASNYRQRETRLYDDRAHTAVQATAIASNYLAQYGLVEDDTISPTITVAKQYVNLARTGQRISTKFTHLGDSGFTWRRIARRSVRPAAGGDPDAYDIDFELVRPVKVRRRIAGRDTGTTRGGEPYRRWDEFDRTVTNGTSSDRWGISTSGYAYAWGTFPGSSSASVGEDVGTVIVDGGASTTAEISGTGAWSADLFTMTARVRWNRVPDNTAASGKKAFLEFDFGIILTVSVSSYNPSPDPITNGGYIQLGSEVLQKTAWSAGVWYRLRLEMQSTVLARVKVWKEAEGEPSAWTLTDSSIGATSPSLWAIAVGLTNAGAETASPLTFDVDWIDFSSGPLPEGVVTMTGSSGQRVARTEVAVADGSTAVFYTFTPYRDNSLEIWVDGLTQRVTETIAGNGQFTLDFTPFDGEVIEAAWTIR